MGESGPLHPDALVIKSDPAGLVALAKPAGVLSHPNSSVDQTRALLNCPYEKAGEYFQWQDSATKKSQRLWLLNRLDGATSGVILLARSGELAQHVRQHFRHKKVRKIYAAVVFGRPSTNRARWRDQLGIIKAAGKIRTTVSGNVPAETVMRTVRTVTGPDGALSLLQLEPLTGRSHQLRVQCAHRRLPIVGDTTYGKFRRNREFTKRHGEDRLFLHSFRTEFAYEWAGKPLRFVAEAPLPDAFNAALTTR